MAERFIADPSQESSGNAVPKSKPQSPSSFTSDLVQLLAQLNEEMLIELGKPLPREECLPKRRVANCPACHNRALLDRPEP